jgi:hypothetical protein
LNYFQEREWEEERKIERETERKKERSSCGFFAIVEGNGKDTWEKMKNDKRKEKDEQGPGGKGGVSGL